MVIPDHTHFFEILKHLLYYFFLNFLTLYSPCHLTYRGWRRDIPLRALQITNMVFFMVDCYACSHLSSTFHAINLLYIVFFCTFRSATPLHGFMILNRLGLNNLIEPIAKDLEFQLQDPFLLYRNAKTRSNYLSFIYFLWF